MIYMNMLLCVYLVGVTLSTVFFMHIVRLRVFRHVPEVVAACLLSLLWPLIIMWMLNDVVGMAIKKFGKPE